MLTKRSHKRPGQNALRSWGIIMRKWACALAGASAALGGVAAADEAEGEAVELHLGYVADIMGSVDGGVDRRGRFLDNLDLVGDFDLEQIAGWRGTTAHVDVLLNSGAMPNDGAGTLQGVDNIEVSSQRLRLFEAWVETTLGRDGSLRFGLYDVNSEFYSNESAGYLIAPGFGIGSEIAATGPNGPSIFPSTALGLRYNLQWGQGGYTRLALLNADASVLGDPEGVDFSFDEGALFIAEMGVEGDQKLALGAWRYSREQDDVRDVDGFGNPVRRAAQGAYIVFEQKLNDSEGPRATHAFVRAGVSDGDTTPFAGGWQAGVLVERVFDSRPDSVFSVGVNQGVLSDGYRQNQIDLGASMSEAETQFEVTYSDRLSRHVTIQPDLQYVRRPSGDRGIDDAVVAGVRISVEL